MMAINKSLGVVMLLSLGLSACASWYDTQVQNPDTYHHPVSLDESYNITGRFLITAESNNYYGNYNWQRESGNDVLAFMSPLGNTVARISVESGVATLVSGGNTYTGRNLDAMMQQQLGFILPLSYLHYWIQGVPLPQYKVQNQLKSGFSQLNWQVEYLKWQDINHPEVLVIHKADLRIKMLINWPESE